MVKSRTNIHRIVVEVNTGMGEQLEPFIRRGTEEEQIEVSADDVLNAIAKGRDIDVGYAVINGDLNITTIVDQLEENENGMWSINGRISFISSVFNEGVVFSAVTFNKEVSFSSVTFEKEVNFSSVTFSEKGSFSSATFNGSASFLSTTFNKAAVFSSSTFSEIANFWGTTFDDHASFWMATFSKSVLFWEVSFNTGADFNGTIMNQPASFMDVSFREKTVFVGLWNDVLRPTVKFITAGRVQLTKKVVTHFLSMDTATVMDGASNPYLKRYINDEQWVSSWRERGNGRESIFFIWELTSHCGKSIGLWIMWSFLFILLFTAAYTPAPGWMPEWWCSFWQQHGAVFEQTVATYNNQPLNFWSSFYFSIVSFTTLGFGDIAAANTFARFLVTVQIIAGYVMLGGLISIFANKFARRS